MPARRIIQLGDPLLRAISTPVATPAGAAPIFDDLRDTLHEFQRTHGFGRGISAPRRSAGPPRTLLPEKWAFWKMTLAARPGALGAAGVVTEIPVYRPKSMWDSFRVRGHICVWCECPGFAASSWETQRVRYELAVPTWELIGIWITIQGARWVGRALKIGAIPFRP